MNNGRMNSRYEGLGQGKKAEKLIQWARDQDLTIIIRGIRGIQKKL